MRASACLLAALALPALAGPASAQSIPDGVHLSSPELCEDARRDGIESVLEQGNLILSARGLEGYEYNCEFLQVTKASRSGGWLVQALCEEPGYGFPDLIAVMPRGEGQLDLTSVNAGDDGTGGNSGSYTLCEGVSLP